MRGGGVGVGGGGGGGGGVGEEMGGGVFYHLPYFSTF